MLLTLVGCTGCDNKSDGSPETVVPPVSGEQQPTDTNPQDSESNVPLSAALRILPLGDSITQGDESHRSYRYPLWKMLVDTGVAIDLVGSIDGNFQGDPVWPDYQGQAFDRDHDGHWGWKAEEVLAEIDDWLTGYIPDVVLMHLGTNDMFKGDDIDETVTELQTLVGRLRAKNPHVVVFVAEPIPASYKENEIESLRNAIASTLPALSSAESPLFVVDQASGFSVDANTYDGVHPNASGEELMAQKWMDAMIAAGVLK
ncbi:MAG: cellulose-binding protein [Gammaproteobacteria bacterium]|nr:cellulose-binding protein [Gammaproteobacteria bacterium]